MALWKDIVSHWDDESRNTALKEVIRDRAEKPVTQGYARRVRSFLQ